MLYWFSSMKLDDQTQVLLEMENKIIKVYKKVSTYASKKGH